MGLPVRLVLYAPGRSIAESGARAAFGRIAQLDRIMSDYRPDSELSGLIDRAGTPVHVSRDLLAVMRRALAVAAATDGAFDPSVGPLVALWRESRLSQRLPDAATLASARSRVGWRRIGIDERRSTIELPPGMRLDLGGVAKGYILQEAIRTLRGLRVPSALAEAGGDIVVGDAPPEGTGWTVEAPGAGARFAERASRLANAALATSGGTAQFVEVDGIRYSHVIDPRTGLGVTSDVLAYVIAPDAALADALATALTVLDSGGATEALARFPDAIASRTVRQ
jgi:thiamine biosynthesis lipoprotein